MRTLALATGVVLALGAGTPRFAPAAKSTIQRTLCDRIEFATADVKMTLDGRAVPEALLGGAAIRHEQTTKLVVTDRFVGVSGGRPVELDRTFDELTRTRRTRAATSQDGRDVETLFESDLESTGVRFSWNERSRAYDVAWAGEEHAAELLTGLSADLDFLTLLPKRDVEVGDRWQVRGADLPHWLSLAGNLRFHVPGQDAGTGEDADLGRQLDENLQGELGVELNAIREREGRRFAVLLLEAELRSRARLEEGGYEVEASLAPEGELVWDLDLSRVHSSSVKGRLTLTLVSDRRLAEEGGEAHDLHLEMTLAGRFSFDLETKAR